MLLFFLIKNNVFLFIYQIHSAEKNFKSLIYYFIEKILSKNTDYFININREDYTITRKYFKKKIQILKLSSVGINLKKLKKYKYNITNKKFRVGVIAAYRNNKGYLDLIKISEFLQKKNLM